MVWIRDRHLERSGPKRFPHLACSQPGSFLGVSWRESVILFPFSPGTFHSGSAERKRHGRSSSPRLMQRPVEAGIWWFVRLAFRYFACPGADFAPKSVDGRWLGALFFHSCHIESPSPTLSPSFPLTLFVPFLFHNLLRSVCIPPRKILLVLVLVLRIAPASHCPVQSGS